MGNAHGMQAASEPVGNRRDDTPDTRTGKRKDRGKTAFNILSFFAAVILLVVAMSTAPAHAAGSTVSLSVGARIPYAGYSTNWMHIDGQMAYCATPSKKTPAAGTYASSALASPSDRNYEATADLWFSFGCPGFDKSLWPDTWYDGSAMTDDRYVALAHILISDSYASDGNAALYGCSSAFRAWARNHVIGFDENANEINPNATGRRILARASEVPASFQAFEIRTGTATQAVIGFRYTPAGSVELSKALSTTQICANNPLYSSAGAVYGIFRDEHCTDLVREMTTNDDGYARADEIDCGTYWVRETTAPANATLDDRAYRIEVADRQTVRVNSAEGGTVYDQPLYGSIDLLLAKRDAETGAHAPQGAASLAGAEFSVRYFANLQSDTSGSPMRTWRFRTDESGAVWLGSKEQAEAACIGGDALITADDGTPIFPVGTYSVAEEKAPAGYLLNDSATTFVLSGSEPDNVDKSIHHVAPDQLTSIELSFDEQVFRNDLKLAKKSHDTNASLRVPFAITNVSTGETHVMVADRNGNASTASAWNPHSRNTNGNDALMQAETISPDDMDDTAGVWFGLDAAGNHAPVNDELSALPYGEYLLEELRCEANEGFDLISKSFWIERDAGSAQAVWMSLSDHTTDIDEPDEPDDPDEPDEPTEPGDPDEPSDPDKPDEPEQPDQPDQPESPEGPDGDSPDEGQKDGKTPEKNQSGSTSTTDAKASEGGLAKTGDPWLIPSIGFFALAVLAAIASALYAKRAYGICLRRRKRSYLRYRS